MTAKRSHPRIAILLRLEPEELARIDVARGKETRTGWLVHAVHIHLGMSERILGIPPCLAPTFTTRANGA